MKLIGQPHGVIKLRFALTTEAAPFAQEQVSIEEMLSKLRKSLLQLKCCHRRGGGTKGFWLKSPPNHKDYAINSATVEAVPKLIKALECQDDYIRMRATIAVGQLGPAAVEAVPKLITLLEDSYHKVRGYAAVALGQMGPAAGKAVPQLIKLLEDSEIREKQRAAVALGQMGPAAAEFVPQLIELLEDQGMSLPVEEAIAEVLGQMGSAAGEFVPQLIKLLENPKCGRGAAQALGQMGPAAAEGVPQLIKFLDREDALVRKHAFKAMLQMGSAAAEAVPRLIKMLEKKGYAGRDDAVMVLGEIGPAAAEAVPHLIKVLEVEDPEDVWAQILAANSLGQIGPAAAEAVPQLIRILEAYQLEVNQWRVRGHAAQALGQIGPAAGEAVPQLIKLLQDQELENEAFEFSAPRCAAVALGQIGPATGETVPHLIKLLESPAWRLRVHAAVALGQMGPAAGEAVPLLIRALEDEDSALRKSAAVALGQMGSAAAQAVPRLITLCLEDDESVRDSAADALCEIGPAALPRESVILVLEHADPRRRAHGLLLQLALSSYSEEGRGSVDQVVATAVLQALWYSESNEVVRAAVMVLPDVLKAAELSTLQLRSLVQRALRMVPGAVVERKLHQLLEERHAHGPLPCVEHAMSLVASNDGLCLLSDSLNSNADARAFPVHHTSSTRDKSSDSLACSQDGEPPLPLYALQLPEAGAASYTGSWTDVGAASSDCS